MSNLAQKIGLKNIICAKPTAPPTTIRSTTETSGYANSTLETLTPRKSSCLWNSQTRRHDSTRGWQPPPDPAGAKPTKTGPIKPGPPPCPRPRRRAQTPATHQVADSITCLFQNGKNSAPGPADTSEFSGTHDVGKMMTRSQWESPIAPFRVGARGVLRFKQSGERTKGRWRFPNYGIAPCCRFFP